MPLVDLGKPASVKNKMNTPVLQDVVNILTAGSVQRLVCQLLAYVVTCLERRAAAKESKVNRLCKTCSPVPSIATMMQI